MVTKRTIFNFFGGYYFCESTDEKPTNVKVNDRILELDTAREYFWDGTTWVLCGSVVYYPISATVTNGTASGATKIATGQTVEVTIVPSSGYALPTSVTVEGATASYNTATGVITLSEVTGDVSITAACVAVFAISVSVTNGSYSGDTTILDGGTANVTIAADTDYVLPSSITVSGATYTYDSTTGVIALSAPTGAVTIAVVCEEASPYPVKGDIINIDMNGDGTDEQYLVLKTVSDSVVEVLKRVTIGMGAFAASGNTYAGRALDTALNQTYYDTLSATAKTAIVDRTIRQKRWDVDYTGADEPYYNATYTTTPTAYKMKEQSPEYSEITRHIYAIGVEDIIEYVGATTDMTSENTTLNRDNILSMWVDPEPGFGRQAFTRDSVSGGDSNTFAAVNTFNGKIRKWDGGSYTFPAFQIDLSKIAWSPMQ